VEGGEGEEYVRSEEERLNKTKPQEGYGGGEKN